jgi:hypothetical protein
MRRILVNALGINLIALMVAGFAATGWWHGAAYDALPNDATIEDLVARLQERGVQLRVVPVMENGPVRGGVFLTTTDRSWHDLNRMAMLPENIDDWQGTVYVARIGARPAGDDWLWQWGDCADHIGPLVVFGDAALRARIKAALKARPAVPAPAEAPRLIRLKAAAATE